MDVMGSSIVCKTYFNDVYNLLLVKTIFAKISIKLCAEISCEFLELPSVT